MPRDSRDTKTRLLDVAEMMFAEQGVWTVTNRQITEAAEQKNESALNYHFGDRSELLLAILTRRGTELEILRGEELQDLEEDAPTKNLVGLLVSVYASCLVEEQGRHYVRIVDQLRGWLTDWGSGAVSDDEHLQHILMVLEERSDPQRLIAMMMLMAGMTASRAQFIADERELPLDHDEFVDTLTDMLAGVLQGPS
jgi:AcrR family transcriptional regulator